METTANPETPETPLPMLVIVNRYPPRIGGRASLFRDLVRNLPADRTWVSTPQRAGARASDRDTRCHVQRAPARLLGFRWPGLYLWHSHLRRAVRRRRPGLILAAGVGSEGTLALRLKESEGIPYVLHAEAPELNALRRQPRGLRLGSAGSGEVIAEAAGVLVSSQACRDEAYKLGIYPHHLHKVLPGVDLQRFRPGEPEGRLATTLRGDGGPVLLSLIGESPGKDLETLLRAFQIVRAQQSGARLALVGKGLRKRCAPLLAECDARGAVTFLEGVRDAELPDLYRSADVYVLAEQDEQKRRVPEGLEMSCVEALASGLPVACTRTRVLEELVTEGEAGLVVEAGAHAKLGRAVLDIVGTDRRRADFARRARERAEAELDAAAASRQVRTFLEVTYYRRLRLAPLETAGPESPGDPGADRD